MKKAWIAAAALAAAFTLTACGAGNLDYGSVSSAQQAASPASSASSQAASSAVTAAGVSNDLAGLQQYLAANASVTGTPTEMRADMIGAKSGVRYTYGYSGNNNVTLELYEYDTANLSAEAKTILDSVKSTGKFVLFSEEISATLSSNGKYLMIFKDTATGDANKTYDETVRKLFTEFKAS
jgi:hypothetical protein